MEKIKQHGGRRPGAGRPPGHKKSIGRFLFRCTDEEYDIIKKKAIERNLSINQYLIDEGVNRA
ncbi:MAG: plasmid mobilization protein [Thermincolia bacterium]